jgi:hypothetical protein
MKRQRLRPSKIAPSPQEARRIDALYGLEPVFEPAQGAGSEGIRGEREAVELRTVQCPYCGESFETLLDTSAGSSRYIEDCQVCCQPIEFQLDVDDTGALTEVATHRSG